MLGASWKTTAAGIVAIVIAVGNAFTQYLQGGLATINWEVLLAGVVAGIGLIMAKDAGVTNSPAPVAARALPVKLPTP
jgi:hypothetical protein